MIKVARLDNALRGAAAYALLCGGVGAAEPSFEFLGYVREHIAVKLEDSPDINLATGKPFGGKGELSMARTTGKFEGHADFGWAKFVGIYRIDREARTSYLRDLEDSAVASSFTPSPPAPAPIPPGLGNEFLDQYDKDEVREAYTSFDIGRVNARLGKQQVAWGETDVIRVTDVVQGYDNRWRSILEFENEELRKPLVMANLTIAVPEFDGSLQLLYRPGWDGKDRAPVNDVELRGGRWAAQTSKGVDSLFRAPFNLEHSSGNTDDANYGVRWSGDYRQIGYSLMYYRGLTLDPIVNTVFNPFGDTPTALGGAEIIFPMTETYGLTFNAYAGAIDSVIRGEFAYSPNTPYNVRGFNTTFPVGPFGPPSIALLTGSAGLGGVIEKATLKSMIGIDKNINLQKLLKTNRPSLWTSQIFDQWIPHWRESDDLVDLFGFGAPKKEHWTVFTSVLALSYRHDTVNPSFTLVYDLSNKDAIFVPGIDFVLGDHWRLKVDADIMLPHSSRKPSDNGLESDTNLFGTFANNSQLNVRLSYYF